MNIVNWRVYILTIIWYVRIEGDTHLTFEMPNAVDYYIWGEKIDVKRN